MSEIAWRWQRFVKRLNVNRVSRANQHYRAIRTELAPRTAREKEEVAFFSRKFEKYHRLAQRLISIRLLFYTILYASILVNVFQVIPLLRFLVTFIELGSSLVGTGLAFAIVLLLSAKVNVYLQLMNQCLVHLASIYQANPKRDTGKTIRALRKTL